MNAIFLLCPSCEAAMLEQTETGRKCPECDTEMTEIEYQMYHAKRAAQTESFFKSVGRFDRKTFGTKKKAEKSE